MKKNWMKTIKVFGMNFRLDFNDFQKNFESDFFTISVQPGIYRANLGKWTFGFTKALPCSTRFYLIWIDILFVWRRDNFSD